MDVPGQTRALTADMGFLMSRASGLFIRSSNAALAPTGLRVRPYSVLVLASDVPDGITQRDLADVLGLDPSQVVLLVDELAASGLVERRPFGRGPAHEAGGRDGRRCGHASARRRLDPGCGGRLPRGAVGHRTADPGRPAGPPREPQQLTWPI